MQLWAHSKGPKMSLQQNKKRKIRGPDKIIKTENVSTTRENNVSVYMPLYWTFFFFFFFERLAMAANCSNIYLSCKISRRSFLFFEGFSCINTNVLSSINASEYFLNFRRAFLQVIQLIVWQASALDSTFPIFCRYSHTDKIIKKYLHFFSLTWWTSYN